MPKTLSRENLYELVWSKPMTHLARDFGVSDVALHKHCKARAIPKPPQGYWLKKQFGKPVVRTPLGADPAPYPDLPITIYPGAGSDEGSVGAAARMRVQEVLADSAASQPVQCPVLARTLTALRKVRPGKDGLVQVAGPDLIAVRVTAQVVQRASALLTDLVGLASRAGLVLEQGESAAVWRAEGEAVSFELVEVPDRIEHVATDKELRAVAKWEAERQASYKRTGYLSEWGEPYIPKWEERLQGRLAFVLEIVRDRSTSEYGGDKLRGKFVDAKNRDVTKAIPQVVAAIAAIAATKRANAAADEQRRLEREAAARRRREIERRAALERARGEALEGLLARHEAEVRLAGWLDALGRAADGNQTLVRVTRLHAWADARLARLRAAGEPVALETWLADQALFDDADEAEL
jgi:hypothetical protein